MKKSLIIQAKFDTSDMDKTVDRMKQKLKDMYAPSDAARMQSQTAGRLSQMGLGVTTSSNQAGEQATLKMRKDMNGFIKEEFQKQEALVKKMSEKDEWIKRQLERQKELVKGSKEELQIKEKIARTEEEQARNKERFDQRDAAINQAANLKEAMKQQETGGLDTPEKIAEYNKMVQQRGTKSTMSTVSGGVAAGSLALVGITKLKESMDAFPMRLQQAQGSAISNTYGKDLTDVYGGRAPWEAAWKKEREAAAGVAKEKREASKSTDLMKSLMGYGTVAAGAIVTGAAAIGTPFTMGGSALGIPAGLAIMGAGGYQLGDDRTRLGLTQGEDYQKLARAQEAEDKLKTYNALKDQDPGKKFALEEHEKSYMRNLDAQRGLGIGYEGFYGEGGLQQRTGQAGFMKDQGTQMGMDILGAGGSARGANQLAPFGLQMQRAGMTNASSILGTLTGGMESGMSRTAVINTLAEGTKIGLNNSEFVEENRRFQQTAASLVSSSGAQNEGDINKILQVLGAGLQEKTGKGVESAATAYQKYQQRGSQLGGRGGAIRFSVASDDPILGRLSTDERVELLALPPDQLSPDDPMIKYMAKKANTTTEKLLKSLLPVNEASRFQLPGHGQEAKTLRERINNMRDSISTRSAKGDDTTDMQSQLDQTTGRLDLLISEEEPQDTSVRLRKSLREQFLRSGQLSLSEEDKKASEAEIKAGKGTLEDKMIQGAAEGTEEARKNFVGMREELYKLAAAAADFINTVAPGAATLHTEAQKNLGRLPKGNAYGAPSEQPQTGSGSGSKSGGKWQW